MYCHLFLFRVFNITADFDGMMESNVSLHLVYQVQLVDTLLLILWFVFTDDPSIDGRQCNL